MDNQINQIEAKFQAIQADIQKNIDDVLRQQEEMNQRKAAIEKRFEELEKEKTELEEEENQIEDRYSESQEYLEEVQNQMKEIQEKKSLIIDTAEALKKLGDDAYLAIELAGLNHLVKPLQSEKTESIDEVGKTPEETIEVSKESLLPPLLPSLCEGFISDCIIEDEEEVKNAVKTLEKSLSKERVTVKDIGTKFVDIKEVTVDDYVFEFLSAKNEDEVKHFKFTDASGSQFTGVASLASNLVTVGLMKGDTIIFTFDPAWDKKDDIHLFAIEKAFQESFAKPELNVEMPKRLKTTLQFKDLGKKSLPKERQIADFDIELLGSQYYTDKKNKKEYFGVKLNCFKEEWNEKKQFFISFDSKIEYQLYECKEDKKDRKAFSHPMTEEYALIRAALVKWLEVEVFNLI